MQVTSLLDNAICKKPTIAYVVYYLLRMNMNMKYGNTVITLFYLSVILIFSRLHFLTDVCLV